MIQDNVYINRSTIYVFRKSFCFWNDRKSQNLETISNKNCWLNQLRSPSKLYGRIRTSKLRCRRNRRYNSTKSKRSVTRFSITSDQGDIEREMQLPELISSKEELLLIDQRRRTWEREREKRCRLGSLKNSDDGRAGYFLAPPSWRPNWGPVWLKVNWNGMKFKI